VDIAGLHGSDGVIRVRTVGEADRDELAGLCRMSESGLARWFDPDTDALTQPRSVSVVDELMRGFSGRHGLTFVVRMVDFAQLVGLVSLQRRAYRTVEITYWIRIDRRGEGLATRAARLGSDVALADDAVAADRVEAIIDQRNPGSARVASKAGFEFAGVREMPAPLAPGGSALDLVFYRSALSAEHRCQP